MIRYFLALLAASGVPGVAGCGKKREETARTDPPEPQIPLPTETPLADATPDETPSPEAFETDTPPAEPPAPYGELTDNQQRRVDTVMESVGEVNANEAKRWTENLAYDETGAERELQVWEAIADAYKRWAEERPGINDAAKREAFNAILIGSLLPVTDALRYVKLAVLTRDDAKAAILLYSAPVPSPPPDAEPTVPEGEPSPEAFASPPPY